MCLIKLKLNTQSVISVLIALKRGTLYLFLVLFIALCITVFNSQGVEYDPAGRVLKLQLNNPWKY